MNRITFLLGLILISVSLEGFGQGQAPSVQIMAKKKSGIFGMGSSKFMDILLSNQKKVTPLTCDNVNEGLYYYFLCKTVGDWKFDQDFMKDELPKLSFEQGEQKLHTMWKEDIPQDGSTVFLIAIPKSLQLFQAFTVRMDLGDEPNQKQLVVPEDYWPGYSLLTSLLSRADSSANTRQYKQAIGTYNELLEKTDLKIFPRYQNVFKLRTQQFSNFFDATFHSLVMTITQPALSTKEKMNQVDTFVPDFRFVLDSLPSASLQISPADSGVHSLVDEANEAILRAKSYDDSLLVVFDNQNTQWIIEGNLMGTNGFDYQHIVPILSYAFSSLDFSDSTTAFKCSLTDEMQTAMTKYKLNDPYESFVRVCTNRFQRKLPIFPGDFLPNLRRDSSAFSLPYFAMLQSIEDFYKKDFASSKDELKNVFRSCDDLAFLARFHQLWIILDIRLAEVPPVVIAMLQETKKAEIQNDESAISDHYKQMMNISPNFAYPPYALAEYYLSTSFPIRSIPFFEKAYQIDKTFFPAYREAYRFYERSGSFKPMIDVLKQALQNGNDYWEVSYSLGAAYMGDGDAAKAAQAFDHALSLNPKSYQTTIQLGLAHQTARNYQKARDYFNKAIELEPGRSEAVGYLKNLDDLQKSGR